MMKRLMILLILLVMIAIAVNAEPEKINIHNLKYEEGDIKYIEKFSKIGYKPDHRLVDSGDYELKIFSEGGEMLYSLKFQPPTNRYIDPQTTKHLEGSSDDKKMGGVEVREDFRFSVITPSFSNEKKIKIFNDYDETIEEVSFEESSNLLMISVISLIVITILSLGFLIIRRRNKNSD